jgi:hypothetical protein
MASDNPAICRRAIAVWMNWSSSSMRWKPSTTNVSAATTNSRSASDIHVGL